MAMSYTDHEENGVVNINTQLLMQMMQGENQPLDSFSSTFFKFIRSNPTKDDIKLVGHEMRDKVKQAHKFKPAVDSFVTLMSLFAVQIKQAQKGKSRSEDHNKTFQHQLEKIEMKLKKEDLLKWIRRVQDSVKDEVKYRLGEAQLKMLKDLSIEEKKRDDQTIAQLKTQRKNLENALRTVIDKLGMNPTPNPIDTLPKLLEKLTQIQKDLSSKQQRDLLDKKMIELYQMNQDLQRKNKELTQELKNQQHTLCRKIQILQKQVAVAVGNKQPVNTETPPAFEKKRSISNVFIDSKILSGKQSGELMFLRKSTEKVIKSKPKSSELLFSSLSDQWSSLHSKIDGRPNLLLLIRLKSRKVVGAFTQQPIVPNCVGQIGFLFLFSHFEYYEGLQGSTIRYDENSLIFGKNELILRNETVRCELGAAGGVFNAKGRSGSFFLGEAGQEAQVESFEVHEFQMQ